MFRQSKLVSALTATLLVGGGLGVQNAAADDPHEGKATPPGAPTCSHLPNFRVHGQHVIRDYVLTGEPGARGGPSHPTLPFAPGASFCTDSNSPGVHLLP